MNIPIENKPSIPSCMIFVGKEGQWYHEGAEIIHRPIFLWLIQSLEKTEDGLFIVNLNNQRCFLEVEDTPLVVQRVERIQEDPAGSERIRLYLNDDSVDVLNPKTLEASPENVLYCLVKEDKIPARFLRPAYYQMAEFIEEGEDGEFYLFLNQRKFPIRLKEE
jgi:uncharacterized protein